jgi:hypothetical protein
MRWPGAWSAAADRTVSFLEVGLFSTVTHPSWRQVMTVSGCPQLAAFCERFGQRESARQTEYRFDTPLLKKEASSERRRRREERATSAPRASRRSIRASMGRPASSIAAGWKRQRFSSRCIIGHGIEARCERRLSHSLARCGRSIARCGRFIARCARSIGMATRSELEACGPQRDARAAEVQQSTKPFPSRLTEEELRWAAG